MAYGQQQATLIKIHIFKPLELAKHQRNQYTATADAATAYAADAATVYAAYAAADAAAAVDADAAADAYAAYAYAYATGKYDTNVYREIRKKYLDNPNPCIQAKYVIMFELRSNNVR